MTTPDRRPDRMTLLDLVRRATDPAPWTEGDNIPWHDPDFSARMLEEHLSQAHDMASRRAAGIEAHVRWIHDDLLAGRPGRVLDLGCGPGLYASRLAALGHECVGIDYSPASIAHAKRVAEERGLRCMYLLQDIRHAEYGVGFDLVMLVFGEFNVFSPDDVGRILDRAHAALAPGGLLLMEPHTATAVESMGRRERSWSSTEAGLFSDRPHLCLTEGNWDPVSGTATVRYFVVDSATGAVTRYAQTFQAYTDAEYRAVLTEHGFDAVRRFSSLGGRECEEIESDLFAMVAKKP